MRLFLVLIFVLGLGIARLMAGAPTLGLWLSLFLVAAACGVSAGRSPLRKRAAMAVFALALGLARGASVHSSTGAVALQPGPVTLHLAISSVPIVSREDDGESLTRFEAKVAAIESSSGVETLPQPPSIRVSVGAAVPDLVAGESLRVLGRLSLPLSARNPGDPASRPRLLPRVHVPSRELLGHSRFARTGLGLFERGVLALRTRAHDLILNLYSDDTRGIVLSLLLGDRRLLGEDTARALERSGTYHFLAISGLHAGLLLALLIRLPAPGRGRTVLQLSILVTFAIVTGAAPPTVRAVVMLTVLLLARATGRSTNPRDVFAWTVFLILFARPDWLFGLGFQLSALAVYGILSWTGRIEAALRGFAVAPLRRSLAVSIAASVFTLPLIVHSFQRFHPLAPLWNLLVYLPVAAILLLAVMSVLLGSVHLMLGAPFAFAGEGCVRLLDELLSILSTPTASCVAVPAPMPWTVSVAVVLLLLSPFMQQLSLPDRQQRKVLCAILGGALATAGLAATLDGRRVPDHALRIWFLDVGDGNAQLLVLPGGERILIDAGSSDRGYRLGRRLARSILSLGFSGVDAIVLSHPDADHVNGVEALLGVISAKRIYCSPYFDRFDNGQRLLRRLEARGYPIERLAGGELLRGKAGWQLRVLAPSLGERLPLARRSNDGSLVLALEYGGHRALFPGDIEEAGTARLLSLGLNLKAGLLVCPHHGRKNRLLDGLLEAVQPSWIVLSSSPIHDAGETLRTLEARAYRVHATWRDHAGEAILDLDSGWTIEGSAASQ